MSSPYCAGGTGLPAALHFYIMYISLGLRRENRLPGGSLLTVVAIFVRIQVEQKGGNLVAAFF